MSALLNGAPAIFDASVEYDEKEALEVSFTLRPYQRNVVQDFWSEVETGKCRVLCVAPTASGKTVIGAEIINRYAERRQGVLVLAHRREIITQTSGKLDQHGVRHGIIQAGCDDRLRPMEPVQAASIQTLHSRAVRSGDMQLPPADLLVIVGHDLPKAHRSVSERSSARTDGNPMSRRRAWAWRHL